MMKKQKNRLRKTLALVFSAVLLVAITVGATVAYLTSTDEVKNTFTVGNVQITLDEADVNAEGKPIKTVDTEETVVEDLKDADRVKANDYHLVPGRDVIKDPTVHVKANSEPCYVRVLVTVANWSNVEKIYVDSNNTEEVPFDQLFDGRGKPDATDPGWSIVKSTEDAEKDTCTFELRWKEIVGTSEIDAIVPKYASVQDLKPVFTGFEVPEAFTNTELAALNGMKIDVVAEAIQAEGFDDADAAWDA